MKRVLTDKHAKRDIDIMVRKILADLGQPEPPLDLELIRDLLKLDLGYYSSTNSGILTKTIHKLRVGGKRIISDSSKQLEAIRKVGLKALWLPEQRKILIDEELPSPKQRWGEAHEIGHSIIPWHSSFAFGDTRYTLTTSCQVQIEAEANYAAGQLLFLQERFHDQVNDLEPGFKTIQSLRSEYGNSLTTTLWRLVESLQLPAFGLIGIHPAQYKNYGDNPLPRHFFGSDLFLKKFSTIPPHLIYAQIGPACRNGKGPIGSSEVILHCHEGIRHEFTTEAFFNGYDGLIFGVHKHVLPLVR